MFKTQVKQVLAFVYLVCNRHFYNKSTKYFNSGKSRCSRDGFTSVVSFNGYKYICFTYVKNVLKTCILS